MTTIGIKAWRLESSATDETILFDPANHHFACAPTSASNKIWLPAQNSILGLTSRYGGAFHSSFINIKLPSPGCIAIAISKSSPCTSGNYAHSHVIKAMGYEDDQANEAVRLSWCNMTPEVPWKVIAERVASLR